MIYRCKLPFYQSMVMGLLRILSGLLTLLTLGFYIFPLENWWSKIIQIRNSGYTWIRAVSNHEQLSWVLINEPGFWAMIGGIVVITSIML